MIRTVQEDEMPPETEEEPGHITQLRVSRPFHSAATLAPAHETDREAETCRRNKPAYDRKKYRDTQYKIQLGI